MPLKGETQTHCDRGHELTEENSYVGKHGRQCKACNFFRRNRDRYGFQTPDERDQLLASQGGCAICKRTDCRWGRGWLNTWHVDHTPGETGTHRGILCGRCNILVGVLESSKELIQKCLDYLRRFK